MHVDVRTALLAGLAVLAACANADTHAPTAAPPDGADGVDGVDGVDGPDGADGPAVSRWDLFEQTLERAISAANPFDPDEVAVRAEFERPDGTSVTIDAFAWQDFERTLIDGHEVLAAVGALRWKLRFTPTEEGRWRWRWRVKIAGVDEDIGDWQTLDVGAARLAATPALASHGFVRRSARDPHQLVCDDGTSVFLVGENLAWYDARGTYAYDAWIAKLAAQGCNFIRIWMPSWAFGLEWIRRDPDGTVASSSLGNYTARLDRAWQLDYVLALAERHGLYVMLSIQNHGAFSLSANSEWADNPYSAENGGPLAQPRDFFTDPEARRLFERRLRYIVARWGYATRLMAWELWNEVDLVDAPTIDALGAWHTAMASELRRLDPNVHLVSTSTSIIDAVLDDSPYAALWQLAAIDVVQAHFYAALGGSVDFRTALPALAKRLAAFGKPVLIAEAGVDMNGPVETLAADPQGEGLHDILWATVFAETIGTGMSWWWDNVIDPQDWYGAFEPLARFVAGIDFANEGFATGHGALSAPDAQPLSASVRAGSGTVLVWVTHDADRWTAPDLTTVTGAALHLEGLADGAWTPTWFDTRGAATIAGSAVEAAAGTLDLPVPAFTRDIALRLVRD